MKTKRGGAGLDLVGRSCEHRYQRPLPFQRRTEPPAGVLASGQVGRKFLSVLFSKCQQEFPSIQIQIRLRIFYGLRRERFCAAVTVAGASAPSSGYALFPVLPAENAERSTSL